MSRSLARVLLISTCCFFVACGGASTEAPRAPNACTPDSAGAPWTFDDATSPGPYAVGTMAITLVDSSRGTVAHGGEPAKTDRTLDVWIWYPAESAGANTPAASGGPFPIVGYSHGFSSTAQENPGLGAHLASHGYIMVAPSFPLSNIHTIGGPTSVDIPNQPGDISFVIDSILAMSGNVASPLHGAADPERIAAAGLSMGGMTTLLTTFHPTLRDPRIDVAVTFAPASEIFGEGMYATVNTPLLVLHGDADAILEYRFHGLLVSQRAQAPVSLLTLRRGTHTGFTAISTVFEGTQGYEHIDTLGCQGLGIFGGGGGPGPDLYTLLGGADAGLVMASGEAAFCPPDLGVGMSPTRQLAITNAATLAFLDSYLSNDVTVRGRACAFSERALPRADDITLTRR